MLFLSSLSGRIIFLFEVAELMRRAADDTDTTFATILKMGVSKLPETVEHIMPFKSFSLPGMFTFWWLTRSQELIIARAAGVSAWQFLMPALVVTMLFGFLNTTLINPIGAALNARYHTLEARYLQHTPTLELTGAGLWLRQRDKDRHYLLHADHVGMAPLTLEPVIVFIFDADDKYLGRIDAPQAVSQNGYWEDQGCPLVQLG